MVDIELPAGTPGVIASINMSILFEVVTIEMTTTPAQPTTSGAVVVV